MPHLHAIIMAGGAGTRFWPASRARWPKHFLPLAHGKTLLEATVDRVRPLVGLERTWIVTNPTLAALLPRALPDFPAAQVLVEPEARDTAPCIALASAMIEARDPGAVLALMPSDHLVDSPARFGTLLERAAAIAGDGETLVTLGIPPRHAATGYGYIERGAQLDEAEPRVFRVQRFTEKPDQATAESFIASGRFLWNSGVFVWTTPALLAAMNASHQALAQCTRQMLTAAQAGQLQDVDRAFREAPRISIDYAVMEHAPRIAVVEADLGWDDLGSFQSLGAVRPADANGNIAFLRSGARSLLEDSEECTVYADGPTTVVVFGMRDTVVVSAGDTILVCPRHRTADLKRLIARLPQAGLEDLL